jgi:hypothetical protein
MQLNSKMSFPSPLPKAKKRSKSYHQGVREEPDRGRQDISSLQWPEKSPWSLQDMTLHRDPLSLRQILFKKSQILYTNRTLI